MNQTIVYTYDNGGNIKSKKIYAYTTGTVGALQNTINYTYDSTWKDKLTNYNGTAITYDAIGNPLTYRNGMSFTWNGRQMATANLNGTAVTYKYDADGLRTTKQVGSTLYEYEYVGGQLVYEKRGDLKFYYRYNAMGELASIKRINAAGSEYTVYVVTNTRGDVEELRLADGSLYARYVYDSWGNVLHVYNGSGVEETNVNALSLQNPFRYRSYYYDAESGLYYLQSRYYDPVTCRFVNADGYVSTGNGVLSYNMYAYCGNNPVNRSDASGMFWKKVGQVFRKAWDGIKTWVKNTFGAEATVDYQAEQEAEILPQIVNKAVTVKHGTRESKNQYKKGNSSKPVSVYAQGRSDNYILSSVGAKVNVSNMTFDFSIGADDLGISGSYNKDGVTHSFSIKADVSQFKIGVEYSTSSVAIWDSNTTISNYINVSITGWSILATLGFSKVKLPQVMKTPVKSPT